MMEEMLNKLEFMLQSTKQMNINIVCSWFRGIDREVAIKAIEDSNKFIIKNNMVSLKTIK